MNRRIFRCLAASFAAIAAGAFAEAPQSDTSPTAADLTSMLSAKATASPRVLFGNYSPAFVYIAECADPFLSTDDRREEEAAEAFRPVRALAESTQDGTLLKTFIEKYDGTEAARQAGELLKALPHDPVRRFPPRAGERVLPTWIASNLGGAIYDGDQPSESVALVGDYVLKAGDRIPRYPEVVIAGISTGAVTVHFDGRDFELKL